MNIATALRSRARRGILLAAVVGWLGAPESRPTPPQSPRLLDEVSEALGGKARILGARSLLTEGTGFLLYFGQTVTPYDRTHIELRSFRRVYDLVTWRGRVDQVRLSGAQATPLDFRLGLDGDVGYAIVAGGSPVRTPSRVARDQAAELRYHPLGFLRGAWAAGARVRDVSTNGIPQLELRAGGDTYTMEIEPGSKLPRRISRLVSHPMIGDQTYTVELADWSETAGLRLPGRMTHRWSRWTMADYHITHSVVDADLGDLAAPAVVRAAPVPPEGITAPVPITVEGIAPGVWLLTGPPFNGADYHMVAIEQDTRVILVEAPDNEDRARALIARARLLVPNKPVGPLINTHHHFDHAGGLRAAVAEGLPIVTHHLNADFYERFVFGAPRRVRPDLLARSPRAATLTPVSDPLRFDDSIRPVHVYPAEPDAHAGSQLVVHLPLQRLIIQADLDGAPGDAPAPALVQTVREHRLGVERVVGIHGPPTPWRAGVPEPAGSSVPGRPR